MPPSFPLPPKGERGGQIGPDRHSLTHWSSARRSTQLAHPSISILNISGSLPSPSSSSSPAILGSPPPPSRDGEGLSGVRCGGWGSASGSPREELESLTRRGGVVSAAGAGATSRGGGSRRGVVPLLYCVVGAPTRPYFSTTAATFLASSSASTLVAASA